MDLRNQSVTLGELLADPRSRAVFQRRFGRLLRHPMAGAVQSLTLDQLCRMAAVCLPDQVIADTLQELRSL